MMGKLINILAISGWFLLMIVSACEEQKEIVGTVQPFEISQINFPAVVSSSSAKPVLFSAKVTHPDGNSGIAEVILLVNDSLGASELTLTMYDDGNTQSQNSGDVIAFDQVYSRMIIGNELSTPDGRYLASIRAVSSSGDVKESPTRILDIFFNQAPEILDFSFPDSIVSGMPSTNISFTVNDNDGLEDINWILLYGFIYGHASPSFQDTIYNPMNNSSLFQKEVDSSYAVGRKGTYEMIFVAEDRAGEFSLPQSKMVFFENNAPILSASQVPDTLLLPLAGSDPIDTLITIRVNDGQSLADVEAVYYYSLKPDSTLANNGNPLFMWDNGLPFLNDPTQLQYAGDQVAGDGIFSFTILLPAGSLPGRYRFSFYALDRMDQESQVWVDSVWVRN
jgi:hypothetical protein